MVVLILACTTAVVAALFGVLWRASVTSRDRSVALVAGGVLSLWAALATVLAQRGVFQPREGEIIPPVGINLIVVLALLVVSLAASVSLRRLLTRQADLICLHLWRLVGVAFLVLMARAQVPVVWALPAGVGDILIAVTAPWVARRVGSPQGHRRAVVWNLFGMADLIVAVGLGIMTSPGPTQVFETVPTAELMTHFPLALVPTFLVPLAFMLHVISLWQLLGCAWTPLHAATASVARR